ncbi:MAG: glycosyltransferase family 4 protein [Hyphomicrobium sp.]
MRILHCLRAPVGGLFRHVLDLAAEQAARGHQVGILADSNAENRLTAEKFADIAPALDLGILRTPMSRQPGIGDYKAFRTVVAHARTLDLDVLHGHGAKGGAYARLARRALRSQGHRVKAFYTPHGGSLNYRPGTLPAMVFLNIEHTLERFTDGLIFESAYAARVYRQRVGAGPAPERVIPNGVQPQDFIAAPQAENATDFLFIGELREIKGVNFLLEALARLNEKAPVTATIVGAGQDEAKLMAQAQALGLADKARFTGALPARDALALGRIMVVPSLAESFPYVVLEAAAAGLPLISTSVGGIPEIVAGTDTGLMAAGSTGALAAAMAAALADRDGAKARADRLKANVAQKFTVAGMSDAVLRFYALTND